MAHAINMKLIAGDEYYLRRRMAQPVPESVSFPEEEDKIYEFWKSIDAFRTSLKLSKGRPRLAAYGNM